MSERAKHTFEFPAEEIARAASTQAKYHEERASIWHQRGETALERVKATIRAKVVEQDITGGKRVAVVVEYGDPEAWSTYQLADSKERDHRAQAERFRSDETVYASQSARFYELDADDVHHFRLDKRVAGSAAT